MMFAHLTTLLLTLPLPTLSTPLPSPHSPALRLHPDLTFKIAAFSDQHYGENEDSFGIPQDINSTALTRHILATESPDLAVLNGDLITGENTFRENASRYIDVLVAPFVERQVPWASTYGNHDSKFNLSRSAILAEEQMYPLALTQHGPPGTDGVSNYMVPIYGPTTSDRDDLRRDPLDRSEKPKALLYFLDSRGGSQGDPNNNDNIPNHVTARTAAWLASTSTVAEARWGVLPSLVFVHIPVQAFLDLQNARSNASKVGGANFPGLNADIPLDQQDNSATGPYAGRDVPFMRALLGMKGLHSVYSGHDHGDAWCGTWLDETTPHEPVWKQRGPEYAHNGRPFLCFGKPSGFGGYGTWNRGVRQIALTFDKRGSMHVETWVRMQTGADHPQIVTRVGLNATYGLDRYSTEDGGYHPYS